jgi:enterochelin esterase family protein
MPSPFPQVPVEHRGTVHCLQHHSELLQSNPFGDPSTRDLHIYTPPGFSEAASALPAILILPGYTGMGEKLLARGLNDVSIANRIDRLIMGGSPPFIAVMPDCMTTLGGSQYVDSEGLGAYASYLRHEICSFVDTRLRTSGRWGVVGHSSGGFGALHLAMTFPGAFQAVACHAGDMGFDLCYLSEFSPALRAVQRAGGVRAFIDGFWSKRGLSGDDIAAMSLLCLSCAYSPEAGAEPLPARLPIDLRTGEVDFGVLQSWARLDPLVRVEQPECIEALGALDLLFIDAGNRDEYNLHIGARRLCARLSAHGVAHEQVEFDGGHRGSAWRYSVSLARMAEVLGC